MDKMQESHIKKISLMCTIIGLTVLFAITYFVDPPTTLSNFDSFNSQTITSQGKVITQKDLGNVTYITADICEKKDIILFKNTADFRNKRIEIKGTVEDDQIIADEVRES